MHSRNIILLIGLLLLSAISCTDSKKLSNNDRDSMTIISTDQDSELNTDSIADLNTDSNTNTD
ncbi:MAG: hypothetical protein JXR91_04555, partial [Deltaproteobacteria bacterium]|nr:hypothetical protein [Deltaproteobacteria bacterium]